MRRRVPTCSIQQPILPPILGAALLALEFSGVPISQEVLEKFKAQKITSV
ncbi:MAG: hypothetical protein ONB45_22725 [candidate division KSB1 bacterium]|nr:hypothetical protein [candidate division KSB1 bacterium]